MTVPAVTKALAEHACGRLDLPDQALELSLRSLVDTVAVTIGARDDEAVRILHDTVAAKPGRSSLLFADGSTVDVESAALLNGTAAHALDFDHGANAIHGHPGAVLWPVVLAVGEEVGASGRELLEAYVVGFTVCAAIAQGLDLSGHYARGWHSTSTTGVFGAVAAAGRLMGLSVEQMRCGLGLAGSLAGGSRQNFGTMTKPLHTGVAARDGVFAARLAGGGFTADKDQLESALGFFAMYSETSNLDRLLGMLTGPPPLVADYGIGVKLYPCCYSAHRAASAALALHHENGVRAEEIDKVRLTLELKGFESLNHHRPATAPAAKFSGEYVVAAALLDGYLRLDSFTDEAVRRPEVKRLIELVEIEESANPPVGGPTRERPYFAVVAVETARGTFTQRVDSLRGDRLALLEREALDDKFRDCVAFSGTGWDADALLARLWSIGDLERYTGLRAQGGTR